MRAVVLCVVLAVIGLASSQELCGKVFDGFRDGDVSEHVIGEPFGAHWTGFEPKKGQQGDMVLNYEWCVVSRKMLKDDLETRCSNKPFFTGFPDVLPWSMAGRQTRGTKVADDFKFHEGNQYFVAVRAVTSSGHMLYGVSDGFTATKQVRNEEANPIDIEPISFSGHSHSRKGKRAVVNPNNANVDGGYNIDFNLLCPIDEANRCRQAQINIGDYLTDIYGPPEWALILDPFREYYKFTHFDDDGFNHNEDSSNHGYFGIGAVLGIAFGVAGLMTIAMLLIALLTSFNRKSDKFKTNVHRHDNYEEF